MMTLVGVALAGWLSFLFPLIGTQQTSLFILKLSKLFTLIPIHLSLLSWNCLNLTPTSINDYPLSWNCPNLNFCWHLSQPTATQLLSIDYNCHFVTPLSRNCGNFKKNYVSSETASNFIFLCPTHTTAHTHLSYYPFLSWNCTDFSAPFLNKIFLLNYSHHVLLLKSSRFDFANTLPPHLVCPKIGIFKLVKKCHNFSLLSSTFNSQ